MIDLCQIIPIVLDPNTQECLVLICRNKSKTVLYGNYINIETVILDSSVNRKNNIVIFEGDFRLIQNVIYALESKEMDLKEFVLRSELGFIEIDAYKEIVDPYVDACFIKKNVGFRATMTDFQNATIDFVRNGTQYSLSGEILNLPMLDIKGELCFSLSDKNPFLKYLLDNRYIDITAIIEFKESLAHIKDMTGILLKDYNFKVTGEYNMDNYDLF